MRLAVVALAVLAARPSLAITASPTVLLTQTGPLDDASNTHLLVETYDVGCSVPGTRFGWQGIDLIHSEGGELIDGVGGLGIEFGTATMGGGTVTLSSVIAGAKVFPRFRGATCSDNGSPVQTSPPTDADGPALVIPPFTQLVGVSNGNADGSVQVGQVAKILVNIGADPKGNETITVVFDGPGISFSKSYANLSDFAIDPERLMTATGVGTITHYVVLNPYGSKSNIVAIPVTDPSAAATDAGPGSTKPGKGGCNAGGPGTALLGMLALFKRKARPRRAQA